jgi:hypothetical protein
VPHPAGPWFRSTPFKFSSSLDSNTCGIAPNVAWYIEGRESLRERSSQRPSQRVCFYKRASARLPDCSLAVSGESRRDRFHLGFCFFRRASSLISRRWFPGESGPRCEICLCFFKRASARFLRLPRAVFSQRVEGRPIPRLASFLQNVPRLCQILWERVSCQSSACLRVPNWLCFFKTCLAGVRSPAGGFPPSPGAQIPQSACFFKRASRLLPFACASFVFSSAAANCRTVGLSSFVVISPEIRATRFYTI